MRDEHGGERVNIMYRGVGFVIVGLTGTMAAALGANSIVFAMRADPTNKGAITVENLRLAFTTIAAFTTPITAARALAVFRASGAAATGGTALTPTKKRSNEATREANSTGISDARIATTAALGAAGIVVEANQLGSLNLVHVGAAGGNQERIYEFHPSWNIPPQLLPGELLVVTNPAAMDAGGTWQLAVDAHYNAADVLL